MSEIKKLQGKVAIITGGTTGIGLATAKLFVKEGAYVFITGRRQKELDVAVRMIGSNVTGVQGDIAKLTDLDRLYETVATKGRIDVVFANAGVAEFASLDKITEEHFDQLFNINVKGTLFTVQKALPLLNDGGSIILAGSVASVKGTPPSGSTARRRLLSVPLSEPGPRNSKTVVFVPTLLARGPPTRLLLADNQQMRLPESCPPSRWDAWGIQTKLPKLCFFWRRMTPVSPRVSNCSLTAAEGKSDGEPLPRSRGQGRSHAGFFRRSATVFKISCGSASSDAARASDIVPTSHQYASRKLEAKVGTVFAAVPWDHCRCRRTLAPTLVLRRMDYGRHR